jgi:hypothetical protein
MAENVEDAARAADAERALARMFAVGIPVVTLVAAIGVGAWLSVGPAILVVAAGTLLGVIALIWASLRTLSGDAPLPEGMEGIARRALVSSAGEQKRRVLRALKDLELEHSIGKIDDADFAQVSARYRDEAKALMREADIAIDPLREKAEALARAHLVKKGLAKGAASASATEETDVEATGGDDAAPARESEAPKAKRPECPKCSTSNEPDAVFCKKCGTSLTASEASDANA